MPIDVTSPFWIEGFQVDPDGLKISGPNTEKSLEPKIMNVLILLAERAGETVLRESFMDRVWGVEFGSDESLTRAVSVLRKIFRSHHGRRIVIETVPRKGYRLIAAVSATPQNTNKVDDTAGRSNDMSSNALKRGGAAKRPLVMAGIAATLLVFAAFAFFQDNRSPQVVEKPTVIRNSVSVEPFAVTGGDEDSIRLASSVTSQIAAVLTERGIATTLGTSQKMRSEFILSGDVWSLDGEPQATLRLKETQSGLIIWSEIMDRSDNAAPDYGFGVAVRVSSVLTCLAGWRNSDYKNTPENLQSYARYCASSSSFQFADAAALTEPIYSGEPDNPVAIALHANSLLTRSMKVPDDQVSMARELRQDAANLATEALALAPESDLIRGMWALNHQYEGDPAEIDRVLAEVTASRGLPQNIYWSYGTMLRSTGRIRDAEGVHWRMVRSDPYNVTALARLGWLYATQGDFRQAERYFNLAENINPDAPELVTRRRQLALWLGDDAALTDLLANWPFVETRDSSQLEKCLKIYVEEKLSPVPNISRVMESRPGNDPVWIARMMVGLGDLDSAYAVIDDYDWAAHPGYTIHLFYPDMQPFRADPRFWTLVEKIGLVDYWESTQQWPDFCLTEDHGGYCPLAEDQTLAATR